VPAGDILVPLEWATARVWALVAAKPGPHGDAHASGSIGGRLPPSEPPVPTLERALLRWPVYGLVVLALLAAATAVLVLGAA
jgi:hypothetical protein